MAYTLLVFVVAYYLMQIVPEYRKLIAIVALIVTIVLAGLVRVP